MWFNSRKILRATAVASPLRGRPEMRHATSVRFHDLALGKRPAVFTIVINQVDGNALSRSRHLQLLIQFNRYCRIDRLQKSRLALHAMGVIEIGNQLARIKHPERTEKPDALHCRMCRERALDYPGVRYVFQVFSGARAYPWRSFRPALIGSWDY